MNVDDTPPSLEQVLARLELRRSRTGEEVELDLSDCGYLGPLAVCMLGLAHRSWEREDAVVSVRRPNLNRLLGYCRFSGLAHQLWGGAGPDAEHPDSVTTAMRLFNHRDNTGVQEICKLVDRFVPMSSATSGALWTFVGELVQNVVDHADAEGVMSARVFKGRQEVRVCVADLGEGLRKTLSEKYGVEDDRSAVRLALQAGTSSHGQSHNMGQGLRLLDDMLAANGGSLLLASGDAFYLRREGRQGRVRNFARGAYLPGTLCLMTFRIDNALYEDDGHDDDDIW